MMFARIKAVLSRRLHVMATCVVSVHIVVRYANIIHGIVDVQIVANEIINISVHAYVIVLST